MSDTNDKSKEDQDNDTSTEDQDTDDSQEDGDNDNGPAVKEDGKHYTNADIAAIKEAAAKARRELRVLKKGKTSDTGKTGDQSDGAPDIEKAKADAAAAERGQWKPRLIRSAARAAFLEAGYVAKGDGDSGLARLVNTLSFDDLDVDDDGSVDGLDEQIAEIKAEFPEKFAGTRQRGRIDGADKDGRGNGKPKTASALQADFLLGKTR